MFFTQEDYRKIEKWLLANSRKDTEFAGAATPLKGNETVVLVQNGKNVKASVKDVVEQLFLLGVSDFVNITDKYNESYISLSQAIELIPYKSRKIGQVVTFLDDTGKWAMFQFQGLRKNQWNTLSLWVDLIDLMTGMTIIDSEDIVPKVNTQDQTSLYLADKQYNTADYSGLGRKYLRKNIVTVTDYQTGQTISTNLLTQDMINKENTIYHIQYDYNLNGQTITIPDNCVLQFEGGSLKNGTLNGINTNITDGSYNFIHNNLKLSGTWTFKDIKPEWFTVKNDTQAIQSAINLAIPLYKNVILSREYSISSTINIDREVDSIAYDSFFTIHGGTLNIQENVSAFGSSFEYNNTPNSQWINFSEIIFEGRDTSFVLDRNKILRSKFNSCTFHTKLLESEDYVQTLYFVDCEIRNLNGTWMKCKGGSYDIKITNCMFDNFNGTALELYKGPIHINSSISIVNSLLEGLTAGVKYNGIAAFSVVGCYFEGNKEGDIICVGDAENYGISIIGNFMYGNREDNTEGNGYYHIIWRRCLGGFSASNSYGGSNLHYMLSSINDAKIHDPLMYSSKRLCNQVSKLGKIWYGDTLPNINGGVVNYAAEINVGDIIINTNNQGSNTNIGWVCTKKGVYNTAEWVEFGSVEVDRKYYQLDSDLNTFTKEGLYYPPQSQVSTTTGLHFPINKTGLLEVINKSSENNQLGIIQRYYPLSQEIFFYRTYYGYGGVWSEWSLGGYNIVTDTTVNGIIEGQISYNSTLKKMILWNGTTWVNMDGTALT